MIEKVKLNEVAKDLNISGKDLTALLQQRFGGEAKKPQTVLSGEELNFVMEHYTQQHAVKDFGEYFKLGEKKPAPAAAPKPAEKPAEKPVEKVAPAPAPAPRPAAPAPRPQQPAANGQGQNRPQQGNNRPQQGNNRPQQGNNRPQGDRRFENNRPQGDRRFDNNRPQQGNGLRPNLNQKPAAPAPAPKPAAPQQPAGPRKPIEIRQQAPKQKGPKGENTFTANTVTRTTVDMRTSEVNLDKYNERYEQIAPAGNMKDNFAKKQKLNQKSARRGKPVLSRKEREEEKMRRLELERQRRQRLEVALPEEMTVGELALTLKVQASEIVKKLMGLGVMASISDVIDFDTASLVAMEIGAKVTKQVVVTIEDRLFEVEDKEEAQEPRPPIVVVMGHVDHGKTSILDAIRKTSVVSGEAGGITQHIGAYQVEIHGKPITFLDTPGHEAFTSMRARGAMVTDIAILVVAAEDGIMPQTVESINHAKAANIPILVAVNKIDKPEADPDRVKNELSQYGILPEEWGGESQFVHVSAKAGTGIDDLLDAILLQAEVLELKAVRNGMASGAVIESFLDKGRGPVATVLVREGTLHKGDIVLCGFEYGRVRAMRDELGREVLEAGPSIPVEILGLSGVPAAGDEVTVVRDEKKAREVALYRQGKFREVKLARQQKSKLENMFANMTEGEVHEVNIVLKADVQGSVEAISDSLLKLSTDEVKVKIIGSGVGGITETDATLAAASNAILVGFNVRADASARKVIEAESLDLRYYSVIYNLIDEVKAAMSGMLSPELKQQIIGLAEVRDVFKSPKFGAIAGCMVTEGTIKRHNPIRVLRDNVVIYEGELESLRRFKDDVNEVRNGMECGIGVKNYNDVRVGDMIEVFEIIEIQRSID